MFAMQCDMIFVFLFFRFFCDMFFPFVHIFVRTSKRKYDNKLDIFYTASKKASDFTIVLSSEIFIDLN